MIGKKEKNLFYSFIFVLFLLFLAQCSYINLPKETPSEVVQKYYSAMKEYDLTTMQECLDSKAKRTNSAVAGLMGDLIGGLAGIDFDMGNLMDLAGPITQFNKAMGISGPYDSITLLNIEKEQIDEDYTEAEVLALYEHDLTPLNNIYGSAETAQSKISYRVKYYLTIEENQWKIYKEDNLDKEKLLEVLQS